MPARPPQGDRAVSPVVGMVLVLAISVLGITAVLVWGLPAIQEMKASVEHQSIATEFHALDADIKELAKATASKTAKLWRFSQSQGDFSIQANTERWVLGMDVMSGKASKNYYNFTLRAIDDQDNKFVLVNNNVTHDFPVHVKVELLDASSTVPLTVHKLASVGDPCPASPVALVPPVTVPKNGGEVAFCLYTTSGAAASPVKERLHQIEVQYYASANDKETAAWFWVMDAGRAQWSHATGQGVREVYESNGAVLQGTNGKLGIDGDPVITPPTEQAGKWRFFARLITLNGTASLGGQARIDVLLNLYGSRGLADEVEGTSVKIWTYGRLEATWDRYLLENDYHLVEKTAPNDGGATYLLFHKPSGVEVIVHHSTITAKG